MVVWKNFLAGLASLFSPSLVLDSGRSTALLLIFLFVGSMLWQAVTKGLVDSLSGWFKLHSRGLLLFVYGFPVLTCLIARSFYSAAVMAVVALAAWLLHRAGRLRWHPAWLIALQVVVLSSALLGEAWLLERRLRAENESLQVYVVQPFQPSQGEALYSMVSLSRTFREIVGTVFDNLVKVKVRVEPVGYTQPKDLDDWKTLKAVQARLAPIEPDVVLVSWASLKRKGGEDLLSLSIDLKAFSSPADLVAVPGVKPIQRGGRREHFSHLALRASLEIFEALKRSRKLPLEEADEQQVLRNVLSQYNELVANDLAAPEETVQATQAALAAKALDQAQVWKLVRSYPEDETETVREILKADNRLGGVGNEVRTAGAAPRKDPAGAGLEPRVEGP